MFTLKTTEKKARRGKIHTPHGIVQTPFFMPVATQSCMKGGVECEDLKNMGFELVLSNTYHLHLRPGEEIIKHFGGIAQFNNWNGPTLTDSGGYQVYSLAKMRKITEDGVEFASHIDGSKKFLSPERVVEIQNDLGVDIAMVLDECPPYPCTHEYAKQSLERTTRWAKRCKHHWKKIGADKSMMLFPIVQGAVFEDLRIQSAQDLTALDMPGYAIGGLAVGEPSDTLYDMLDIVLPLLPEEKPRYLMGVGTPENILEAVKRGVDMFDCVMPSRNARHGKIFTRNGDYHITNKKYEQSKLPLEEGCTCHTCQNYTQGFLKHLFSAKEVLAQRLAVIHNLHFYAQMMKDIRFHIENHSFEAFMKEFLEKRKSLFL